MADSRRKIAVVTGTRAEFGLLRPVMRAVADHQALELAVVVAGWHLVSGTWREVKRAGHAIDARVPMQRHGPAGEGGRAADVAALGRGIGRFGKVFEQMQPNVVVVLGDRIEAFAAASAASVGGFRLAHIHGGDRAEGVADEAMRHAITKLAHLHLAATAASAKRIIRMGEQEERVRNVGSPAVDGLEHVEPAEDGPDVLVLQHPIGADAEQERRWMQQTLAATAKRSRLVVGPNGDAGAAGIHAAIEKAGVEAVAHLPRERWLALLAGAKVIVGNSSAGLIEAAVLGTPCVNVGPRQAGRERAGNVVDCEYGKAAVEKAIDAALRLDLRRLRHPYGKPGASERIADVLATVGLEAVAVRKLNNF